MVKVSSVHKLHDAATTVLHCRAGVTGEQCLVICLRSPGFVMDSVLSG